MIPVARWPRFVGFSAVLLLGAAAAAGVPQEGFEHCTEAEGIDEIVFETSLGFVPFPHSLHSRDLEITCDHCHHETRAGDLSFPHPEYLEDFWVDCSACHHATDESGCPQVCSNCHHSAPENIADQSLSSKVVIHQSCWRCHDVDTGAQAAERCTVCHEPTHRSSEKG